MKDKIVSKKFIPKSGIRFIYIIDLYCIYLWEFLIVTNTFSILYYNNFSENYEY